MTIPKPEFGISPAGPPLPENPSVPTSADAAAIVRDRVADAPTAAVVTSTSATPAQNARGQVEYRKRDPHLGLRFWIQLGQIEVAGFRECSGLEIKTETFDYNEGGLNNYAHRLPVRVGYGNITLKRGMGLGLDLFNWYYAASRGLIKRQNISIVMYSSEVMQGQDGMMAREIVQRWDFQNAFPCKWTGPNLDADKGAVAIETLEIAHEGLLPNSGRTISSGNSQVGLGGPGTAKKQGQFL